MEASAVGWNLCSEAVHATIGNVTDICCNYFLLWLNGDDKTCRLIDKMV